MYRRAFVATITVTLSLVGLPVTGAAALTLPARATRARFVSGACAPQVANVAGVRCGFVIVPEVRSRPRGATVALAVAVLPPVTQAGASKPPVVFVDGGPGFATFSIAQFYRDSPLRRTRPIVLFDQRGTGLSRPSLDCPETDALSYAELGVSAHDAGYRAQLVDAVRTCRRRLVNSGVDLEAFAGAEMARDVVDVARALGYRQFDVEASSYGTRTALSVLRLPFSGVRAEVLDGTLPPEEDFLGSAFVRADHALDRLFGCARDGMCTNAALRAQYLALVTRLDAAPVTVKVAGPAPGQSVAVRFDGERVAELVALAVSQPGLISAIPTLIALMDTGQFGPVATLLVPQYAPDAQPERGEFLSVHCRDNLPYARRTPPRNFRYGAILAHALADRLDTLADECAVWRVLPASPSSRRPVRSRTPVFMMQGDLDFTTPLGPARRAAARLERAQLVIFPGHAHTVYALQPDDPCVLQLRNAFLDAPFRALDTACVAS